MINPLSRSDLGTSVWAVKAGICKLYVNYAFVLNLYRLRVDSQGLEGPTVLPSSSKDNMSSWNVLVKKTNTKIQPAEYWIRNYLEKQSFTFRFDVVPTRHIQKSSGFLLLLYFVPCSHKVHAKNIHSCHTDNALYVIKLICLRGSASSMWQFMEYK